MKNVSSNKIPTPTPAPNPPQTTAPPALPARRRIRRQFDADHPLHHHPSILLGHEDPTSFQFVRQAVNNEFSPTTNYQQLLSELASQNLWRIMRTGATEAAAVDIQIADQAPQVDRSYEELDSNCRTALAFRDPLFAQTKRQLKEEEADFTRRHILITIQLERARKRG